MGKLKRLKKLKKNLIEKMEDDAERYGSPVNLDDHKLFAIQEEIAEIEENI
jgi:hypothetical protein